MALRVRAKRIVLSTTIAHTQMDATSSPIITILTIQWACQNNVKSDRSEEVSGSADCATSAGFMFTPLGSSGVAATWRRQPLRELVARNRSTAWQVQPMEKQAAPCGPLRLPRQT